MSFSIKFTDEKIPNELDAEYALVTIGDFEERVYLSTSLWSKDDYKKHWMQSLNSVFEDGETKAAFVVEMHSPDQWSHINCWVVYVFDDIVKVHNQLVVFQDLHEKFDVKNLKSYINDYQSHNEDGDEISEWTTTRAELREWLEQLKAES